MGIVILLQAQLVYSGTVRFARPGCTSTGWHTRTEHGTGSYSWQCHGMQLSYTRNPAWLWERRALPYSESMRCDFPFAFPSWFPHSLWMFSGWKDAYKCGNRFGTGVHPLWRPPVSELQQGCRIRNLFRHKIYAKKTTHTVWSFLPMLSTGWSLPSCWEIPPASSSFSGFRIQHPSMLSDLSYRTPALLCFPLLYYFSNIFARLTLISVSLENTIFLLRCSHEYPST